MGGKGPPPKPAHLRARTNKKAGAAVLDSTTPPSAPASTIPPIPNPNDRTWHALTLAWWEHVFTSPMAGQYLSTDVDGLGRIAVLVDDFYKGNLSLMAEIRLQETRFGLSPLDRSRLQWEIRPSQPGPVAVPPAQAAPVRRGSDPRKLLMRVK